MHSVEVKVLSDFCFFFFSMCLTGDRDIKYVLILRSHLCDLWTCGGVLFRPPRSFVSTGSISKVELALYHWRAQIVWHFPRFLCFYHGWVGYIDEWFLSLAIWSVFLVSKSNFVLCCRSQIWTGCFILKTDQLLYAVPVPDFLSGG